MRVILAAVALSALSFVVGVAGDLSARPENAGVAVTVRIPPPIPADAPRARPLPLLRTTAAIAQTSARQAQLVDNDAAAGEPEALAPLEPKRRQERVLRVTEAKVDARLAAKADEEKAA